MRECGKTYGDGDRDNNPSVAITFENDIQQALGMLKRPFPAIVPDESMVTVDERGDKAVARMQEISRWYAAHGHDEYVPSIGVDFETTGLKPYRTGHQIVTCAIADKMNRAIAFNVTPATQKELVRILGDPLIPKVAHNFKFEEQWAAVILKTPVKNWDWCSMTAAHIEDNRGGKDGGKKDNEEHSGGILSLRFQAAARLGVFGFKDATDEYLQDTADDPHGANSFNRIMDCPRDLLLLRNGMDALICLHLSVMQITAATRAAQLKQKRSTK
jgi:hypothetical protein